MERSDAESRHRKVMPNWLSLYYQKPIELVGGSGRHVWDSEGNRYLDFFGGILTTMTGYDIPEVVEAIQTQAGKLIHSSTLYLISPMIELAEKIAELSNIENAKVFFTTSGTEANDTALLLASCFRQSNSLLALRGSYHGRSLSTMSVTGNPHYSPSTFYPFQVNYISNGSRKRSIWNHQSEQEFCDRSAADLRDLILNGIGPDVAALIAEPIQGVGGFQLPPDGYFHSLKRVLDEFGILFISDEVQTGWGRTGDHFWGYQSHDIVPDLLTFAKGIGNGLALAGVVGRAEIVDSLPGSSISTFGGSPLTTVAGLANLNYLLDHDLQKNSFEMGRYMMKLLTESLNSSSIVSDIRGKGLMVGIEICDFQGDSSGEISTRLLEYSKSRGLLVGKGGVEGNVLRISPPLSVTKAEVEDGVQMLIESFHTLVH